MIRWRGVGTTQKTKKKKLPTNANQLNPQPKQQYQFYISLDEALSINIIKNFD